MARRTDKSEVALGKACEMQMLGVIYPHFRGRQTRPES
jgi:hypothetical protein